MKLESGILRSVIGLCLPTFAVVLMIFAFLIDKVPDIEYNERRRVLGEYRQKLLERRAKSDTGRKIVRGKGPDWERAGKMAPGFWGVSPLRHSPQQVLLWYDDARGHTLGWEVSKEKESDYFVIFWLGGMLLLFVLVGTTIFGIRYFVGYTKARDDFLAATAHDLTTPLVGLRSMIGLNDIEAKILNERMIRLVTNIKDFLRLGGRRPAPKREKFNLLDVYAQAYSLFRADYQDLYDGEDIKVDVQGNVQDGEFVPMVCADETLTMQIIWNLLGNDLKYAAPYGPVSVKIRRDADFIRIEFIDEGPGMSPYQMRHAFDRYYRARTVMESGKGGFGIGLCTAREFAAAMGGKLEVCQNQPKGCIFSLALPRAV